MQQDHIRIREGGITRKVLPAGEKPAALDREAQCEHRR